MLRIVLIAVALVAVAAVVGCANMVLPAVPLEARGDAAAPAIDPAAWTPGEQARVRAAFEERFYGVLPPPVPVRETARTVLVDAAAPAPFTVETVTLSFDHPNGPVPVEMALVQPDTAAGPRPVLILQTFCGNRLALATIEADAPGVTDTLTSACGDGGGFMGWAIPMVFGEYISGPPIQRLLDHGLALAFVYPGDIAPDDAEASRAILAQLSTPDAAPLGTVGAWAWGFSRIVDHLSADPRFDATRMGVWGHSRHGKAALVAAAFDPRIALVISHQSGTGGASLGRDEVGESVAQITESYPHWFTPGYQAFADDHAALPVDQHQLLALIAPRPVMLGNARRDRWSDPHGAYRAAQGADGVYRAAGATGLSQPELTAFDPEADLAVFMRNGRHGVTGRDWDAFLAFLDAHFELSAP